MGQCSKGRTYSNYLVKSLPDNSRFYTSLLKFPDFDGFEIVKREFYLMEEHRI